MRYGRMDPGTTDWPNSFTKTLNIIVLTHELEENPSASKPPRQEGLNPSWRGGFLSRAAAEASARLRKPAQVNPPAGRDPPLIRGGPLCRGCRDQFP